MRHTVRVLVLAWAWSLGLLVATCHVASAITLFGTAKDPTSDNSANVGPDVDITPPGSMAANDVVVVLVCYRGTGVTITTDETCGQTWDASAEQEASAETCQVFSTVFDGSWADEGCDGAPQWTVTSGTEGMIGYMTVWRGVDTSDVFDVAVTSNSYTAPGDDNVAHAGMDTGVANATAVYIWNSADNNTWALQAGGPTLTQPETSWRVTSTTGLSLSVGYMTQATAGATGSKTNQQTAFGGDAGQRWWFSLTPTTTTKRRRLYVM